MHIPHPTSALRPRSGQATAAACRGAGLTEHSLSESCARNASPTAIRREPGVAKESSMTVKEPHANRSPAKLCNSRAIELGASSTSGKLLLDSVLWESCASRLACSCYAAGGALKLRFWSWRRDLNPRPSDYKSDALPAELRQPAWPSPQADRTSMILHCQPGQTMSLTQRQSACKQPTGWISTTFPRAETSTRRFHSDIRWDSAERARASRTQDDQVDSNANY